MVYRRWGEGGGGEKQPQALGTDIAGCLGNDEAPLQEGESIGIHDYGVLAAWDLPKSS